MDNQSELNDLSVKFLLDRFLLYIFPVLFIDYVLAKIFKNYLFLEMDFGYQKESQKNTHIDEFSVNSEKSGEN